MPSTLLGLMIAACAGSEIAEGETHGIASGGTGSMASGTGATNSVGSGGTWFGGNAGTGAAGSAGASTGGQAGASTAGGGSSAGGSAGIDAGGSAGDGGEAGAPADDGAIDPDMGPGFCGDVMTPPQAIGKYGYIENVTLDPKSAILRIAKIVLRNNQAYKQDGIFISKDFTDSEAKNARCKDNPQTAIKEGTNYLCGDLDYTYLANGVSLEKNLGAICGVTYAGQDSAGFATFYLTIGIGGITNGATALANKVDSAPHSGSEKLVFMKSQNCNGTDYIKKRCGQYVSGQ